MHGRRGFNPAAAVQFAKRPNAQSSVAFSFAPQPARRTNRRTSPQRAPPAEKLNVDCS